MFQLCDNHISELETLGEEARKDRMSPYFPGPVFVQSEWRKSEADKNFDVRYLRVNVGMQ